MAKRQTKGGRREFLKRVAVAGGAAGVAAAGGAAVADIGTEQAPETPAQPAAKGYHVTPHIAEYYRLARS